MSLKIFFWNDSGHSVFAFRYHFIREFFTGSGKLLYYMVPMNPLFNESRLEGIEAGYASDTMKLSGAIGKTAFLTFLCFVTAAISWNYAPVLVGMGKLFLYGLPLLGLVLALVGVFAPKSSPLVAPVYAVVQGTFLGAISMLFNQQSGDIVTQAVMLTFGILFAMLGLYQTRIITVTARLRSIIVAATGGVMVFYLIAVGLRLFGVPVPMLHDSSMLGIGFSLFVIGLAAFNFLLDFDLMERFSEAGVPRYYEWYCALGFLVTLVWLYLEVLRLLSRRD